MGVVSGGLSDGALLSDGTRTLSNEGNLPSGVEMEMETIPITEPDHEGYRRFLRMDTDTFQFLLQKIEPLISKQDTVMRRAIPAGERLAITLRYLATGKTQSSMAFNFRVAPNTISLIIPAVCTAMYAVLQEYLRVPQCPEDWKDIAAGFQELWNFPNCIGALDGKHINIEPPPNSGSAYWNYKHFYSIVLMALVDANLMFVYVDVGTNGRVSNGGVWDKSKLNAAMEAGELFIPKAQPLPNSNVLVPQVIVADDAFPLGIHLMKPFTGDYLEEDQIIFNYRLSRARRVSENAFGIMASRFRIFQTKMLTTPSNAVQIVMAACALHNFLRARCTNLYTPPSSIDREDTEKHQLYPASSAGGKVKFADEQEELMEASVLHASVNSLSSSPLLAVLLGCFLCFCEVRGVVATLFFEGGGVFRFDACTEHAALAEDSAAGAMLMFGSGSRILRISQRDIILCGNRLTANLGKIRSI
ncbi:uncharacterized protein LOC129218835 [Uloborus diversus]|uniref:uncharacterized protein LOC129218835 n=1 Tax=Uloborus diversus TaxID=327109 RepID=UPI002409CEE2|nr:uncharacterized protein LOC129218835 [Uloborus diversus]